MDMGIDGKGPELVLDRRQNAGDLFGRAPMASAFVNPCEGMCAIMVRMSEIRRQVLEWTKLPRPDP